MTTFHLRCLKSFRPRICLSQVSFQHLGDSKITDLQVAFIVIVRCQKNISWLDVTMDDATIMDEVKNITY